MVAPCYIIACNTFAPFVPTSSAALGIAFKASLMLCSHLHEQSGRTKKPQASAGNAFCANACQQIPKVIFINNWPYLYIKAKAMTCYLITLTVFSPILTTLMPFWREERRIPSIE